MSIDKPNYNSHVPESSPVQCKSKVSQSRLGIGAVLYISDNPLLQIIVVVVILTTIVVIITTIVGVVTTTNFTLSLDKD